MFGAMHVRRGYLGWGVFLIVTGAVPLLVRSGYLSNDQLSRVWELWPLILVGIGVGLIAASIAVRLRRRAHRGGDARPDGRWPAERRGRRDRRRRLWVRRCDEAVPGPRRDALREAPASVELKLDCGTLTVAGASRHGLAVEGRDAEGVGPDVSADADSLSVESRHGSVATWWNLGERKSWQITVPGGPRLDLDLQLNAGTSTDRPRRHVDRHHRPPAQRRLRDGGPDVGQRHRGRRLPDERRFARADAARTIR